MQDSHNLGARRVTSAALSIFHLNVGDGATYRRQMTGDRSQKRGNLRQETRDTRQKGGNLRHETEERQVETGDKRQDTGHKRGAT